MAERLKALVLKTSRVQKALVGSNPTPSAFPMRNVKSRIEMKLALASPLRNYGMWITEYKS